MRVATHQVCPLAAALESLNAIQRGQLLNVSVQDIIDCSPVTPGYPPRTSCGPGMSTEAMKLTSTSGVTTPPVYGDYTASYGTCKADVVSTAPSGQVLRIPTAPGYVDVTPRSAVAFMRVSSPPACACYCHRREPQRRNML